MRRGCEQGAEGWEQLRAALCVPSPVCAHMCVFHTCVCARMCVLRTHMWDAKLYASSNIHWLELAGTFCPQICLAKHLNVKLLCFKVRFCSYSLGWSCYINVYPSPHLRPLSPPGLAGTRLKLCAHIEVLDLCCICVWSERGLMWKAFHVAFFII